MKWLLININDENLGSQIVPNRADIKLLGLYYLLTCLHQVNEYSDKSFSTSKLTDIS